MTMTRLVPIQAEDYPTLATFCATFPGDTLGAEPWEHRFRFWWEENPAFHGEWVRGWSLLDGTRVVGMLADIPSHIQLLGHETTVSNLAAWRVLPEYQQESSRLLATLLADARARPVFNTTATPQLATLLRSFRFRNLAENVTEHLFVTHSTFLAWQLRQKKKLPGFLATPTAWCALHLQRAGALFEPAYTQEGLHIQIIDSIGPEFDRLWQRTSTLFSFTHCRRAVDLQWIMRSHPLHPLLLCGCYTHHDTLIGYGLFVHRAVEHPVGAVHLLCLDLWSEWTTVTPYVAMIRGAIRYGARNRLAMVIVPHYHDMIARAARLSAMAVHRASPATIYCRLPRGVALGISSEESRLSGYFGDIIM
nr:uncharacterized protein bu93_0130 [uncultured bacterium]